MGMVEYAWRSATSVKELKLPSVAGKQYRKLRLFACACTRRSINFLTDLRFMEGLDAAELFADGDLSREDLKPIRAKVLAAKRSLRIGIDARQAHDASQAVFQVLQRKPLECFAGYESAKYAFASAAPNWNAGFRTEGLVQLALAYDIFGNPFRPVTLDPRWQTETVVALAAGIYADRAFDRMPILADALEEAGCDNADILAHCRSDGPHVRGCWVVDLVLRKE